jgi:hypothetical protein
MSTDLKHVYAQLNGQWCPDARLFSRLLLQNLEQLEQRLEKLEGARADFDPETPNALPSRSQKPASHDPKFPPVSTGVHLTDDPDEIVCHPVEECPNCAGWLTHLPPIQVKRTQVVDLPPITPIVIEHLIEVKECPDCNWKGDGTERMGQG